MRIIKQVQGDLVPRRVIKDDGLLRIHTGPWHHWKNWEECRALQVEMMGNVVVEASFALSGGRLTDSDTGHAYEMTKTGAIDVLEAALQGRAVIEGGAITGEFTFRSMSGVIYLVPFRGAGRRTGPRPVDVAGVPDMTDFIKDLGEGRLTMRIIRELRPAKKATWQLARVSWDNGRTGFWTGADLFKRPWMVEHRQDIRHIEPHANVVVEAALMPMSGCFIDRDDGLHYWANQYLAFAICQAAILGHLPIDGGYILGRFTFKNQSGNVSIALHEEDGQAPATDAPDLTDFLKGLGGQG